MLQILKQSRTSIPNMTKATVPATFQPKNGATTMKTKGRQQNQTQTANDMGELTSLFPFVADSFTPMRFLNIVHSKIPRIFQP